MQHVNDEINLFLLLHFTDVAIGFIINNKNISINIE